MPNYRFPLLVKLLTNDSAVAKTGLRIAMSYVLFYFMGGINAVFASAQRRKKIEYSTKFCQRRIGHMPKNRLLM